MPVAQQLAGRRGGAYLWAPPLVQRLRAVLGLAGDAVAVGVQAVRVARRRRKVGLGEVRAVAVMRHVARRRGDHLPLRATRAVSRRPWALGLATYPVDAFNDATRALLLDAGFVDDDQLERVSGRRLVGYHEPISARLPTAEESDRLEIAAIAPILTLARTARTTTTPISRLAITARTDRLEVDYLIEP